VLAEEEVILDNIPLDIRDVHIKLQMLRAIGARITEDRPGRVRIVWPMTGPQSDVPGEFGSIRTSLLFLGALLARTGCASVPLPGGDQIGERKHDLHLMALCKLGAICSEGTERIEAKAETLVGTRIEFPIRTTGGTENAILASVCAQGRTRLYNAHTRPEVLDLVGFLNMLGARISVLGAGLIEIEGVDHLRGGHHAIIYDNMEAMTFTTFAVITGGRIKVRYFPEKDIEVPMIYLREAGVRFVHQGDGMVIERPRLIAPFDLSTGTYPGVNSDMQPLFAVLATQAEGKSRITDVRFENRFQYVAELQKLGADAVVDGNTLIIRGPTNLRGTRVRATDIRGGAALVAAGLVAEGQTTIEQAEQIDRGYENLVAKLRNLGTRIERVTVEANS
jgi:UDP-N-acetylglucosamine 1-carboxyvinyltransferase